MDNQLQGPHSTATPPTWMEDLTEREKAELSFCRLYRDAYNHGTDGHLIRILVTKMADKLDRLPMPEGLGTPQEQGR